MVDGCHRLHRPCADSAASARGALGDGVGAIRGARTQPARRRRRDGARRRRVRCTGVGNRAMRRGRQSRRRTAGRRTMDGGSSRDPRKQPRRGDRPSRPRDRQGQDAAGRPRLGQRRRLLRRPRGRATRRVVERAATIFSPGSAGGGRTRRNRAESLGVRVVLLRTGVVLGRAGGALAQMQPPFELGLGGPRRLRKAIRAVDSSPRSREDHRGGARRRSLSRTGERRGAGASDKPIVCARPRSRPPSPSDPSAAGAGAQSDLRPGSHRAAGEPARGAARA